MTTHTRKQSPEPASKTIPQYKADDGPLNMAQLRQIRQRAPQGNKHSLRSSLLVPKRAGKQPRTKPTLL